MAEGRRLLESGCATAAIDLSDGLASDLRHLCDESEVGAVIRTGDLPLPEAVSHSAEGLRRSSLDYAIFGGEDYELLVTVEKERAIELQSRWDSALVHITEVGIITEKGEGINLLDEKGNLSELPPGGWDHFGAGPSPG